MAERFQFSPDILSRLGEELVPDVDQGIMELIKNAYDADATMCEVELLDVSKPDGGIVISDNGNGMEREDVSEGWLVLGRSTKKRRSLTPRFGRVPAGDKGLGRLAALRLGKKVLLRTRPRGTKGIEIQLEIDWDKYEDAELIEDVELKITQIKTKEKHGTNIEISNLRNPINRVSTDKLARSILLLSDPFSAMDTGEIPLDFHGSLERVASKEKYEHDIGFKAALAVPEFSDLGAKVRDAYFSDAEYRINAVLNDDATAKFRIFDWQGNVVWQTKTKKKYNTTPFSFDLWVFILNAATFSTRKSNLPEVRSWLSQVGGTHIYENRIRVPPYGGTGADWLDLNLRRSRNPEGRPSTNTSVGRVTLENEKGLLIQKTDRVGYIENEAFQQLQACCADALEWAAKRKLFERDQRIAAEKKKQKTRSERANADLYRTLSKNVPDTDRMRIENAIKKIVKETQNENESLKESLQLYRSLATAGMTSAVFAHEIGRPLAIIDGALKSIRKKVPEDVRVYVDKRFESLISAKKRLSAFIEIPLKILAKNKRRPGKIEIFDTVENLIKLLKPIAEHMRIDFQSELPKKKIYVVCSEALLDGVFVNLITNSFNAFMREDCEQQERKIKITADFEIDEVIFWVEDNAGGILGLEVEDIWLAGQTTREDGTGFGLTIVKDSISDIGGQVSVEPYTEFGGARFEVRFPIVQEMDLL